MERREILESGLIGLMYTLGISKVRMILSLAIIRSHNLHDDMAKWIASYHNSDRDMTAQEFLLKVRELAENGEYSHLARFGGYYNHPELYEKCKRVNPKECEGDDGKD